jgi:tRNA(Arg) A34 adenosine deaminase TadA
MKMLLKPMSDDNKFLRKAIVIAADGIENGGGPFGAVITKDGNIIAGSNNKVVLNADPTAHAEILAIRYASGLLKTHDLSGCVLYTSCEPCPMCLGAIYWSGIKKVVYASGRRDAASAGFNDELIFDEISLDPSKRHIVFVQIKDNEAEMVFSKWEQYDGKTTY